MKQIEIYLKTIMVTIYLVNRSIANALLVVTGPELATERMRAFLTNCLAIVTLILSKLPVY